MISEPEEPTKERSSVFISYRRSDRAVAERLYELLRERNVTAWYDSLIPHGTDWRDAIVEHLAPARVMVVLLSAAALESEELRKELAVAAEAGVPLLPVRLEDIELRGAFAYEFTRSRWFDVFDDSSSRLAALADLLAEVSKMPRETDLSLLSQTCQRRWHHLAFRRLGRWTFNNRLLVKLFLSISMVVLLLYNQIAKPMENLTLVGPLAAFFYLVFVATIGSPALLVSLLLRGIALQDLPLLAAVAANTALLILLARNVLSWTWHRLLRRRASA